MPLLPMKILILSPGKVREAWLQAGIDEYVKRLGRYCQVSLATVDDVPDSWPVEKAKEEEGRRLLAKIRPQAFVVALDLGGTAADSPGLARLLPGLVPGRRQRDHLCHRRLERAFAGCAAAGRRPRCACPA